jgi:carboxymethylenebutenolidase
MDRRLFVTAATATGYALAVSPVTAWAITTSDKDLVTGDIAVPTGKDGKETMPGYFARPKKSKTGGAHPTVLVIQEIFGLHAYVKDVCRRLAHKGYYSVAPSLYFRYGDATKIEDIPKLRTEIVGKVQQKDVMADLDALAVWLGTVKEANPDKMAITGFCWGGNVVWMYAAHNPKLKAGVAWYGRLAGDKSDASPQYPVDVAPALTVPVLGLYGGKDAGIGPDQIDAMRKALAKGKTDSKIVVYPDAQHGFHADYRPSYNEKAAEAGWQELLDWFKHHGM